MTNIKVLSLPSCVQCKATVRKLDQLGLSYEYIDMSTDSRAHALAKALGYLQAPVVIAGESHWSGFDPVKLTALA